MSASLDQLPVKPRPTKSQRTNARSGKSWCAPPLRCRAWHATGEHGSHTVEQVLGDRARSHRAFRERRTRARPRCRRKADCAAARPSPVTSVVGCDGWSSPPSRLLEQLFLGESTGRVFLEPTPHRRRPFWIVDEALAHRPRPFRWPIRRQEHAAASFIATFMPARVRSERTSLSNCAKAASTPSINLPVDVSLIGSVAERREIPSDLRCARSAKWS